MMNHRFSLIPILLLLGLAVAACGETTAVATPTASSPAPTITVPTSISSSTIAQEAGQEIDTTGLASWSITPLQVLELYEDIASRPPEDEFRIRTLALLAALFAFDAEGRFDPEAAGQEGAFPAPHRFAAAVVQPNPDAAMGLFNREQVYLTLAGPAVTGDRFPPGTIFLWTAIEEIDPAVGAEAYLQAGLYVVTPPPGGTLAWQLQGCVDEETGSQEQCTLVGIDRDGKQVFYIDPETGNKLTPDPNNPDIVTVSTADDSKDLGTFFNGDELPPALDGYSYRSGEDGNIYLTNGDGDEDYFLDSEGAWRMTVNKSIVEAIESGDEHVTVTDVHGYEVVLDVVPQEVVDQAEWSWEYRGFIRETQDGRQVWRNLPKFENTEGGRWLNIISEMEVPGYGKLTIEYDPVEFQQGIQDGNIIGFNGIKLDNPQNWEKVLDSLWPSTSQTVQFYEVDDLTALRRAVVDRQVYPNDLFKQKTLTRQSGASIILRGNNQPHFSQAEFWQGDATHTFQMGGEAGRPTIDLYSRYWRYNERDLTDFNIVAPGLGVLDFMLRQEGRSGLEAMLREDGNPWRSIPGNRATRSHEAALDAIGYPFGPGSHELVGQENYLVKRP